MKINHSLIFEEYPYVHHLSCTEERNSIGEVYIGSMHIIVSPFANCQTFSIGNARTIKRMQDDSIPYLIETIRKITRKSQVVVDLIRSDVEIVMGKLNPYIEWKESIEYTNSTGTLMTLFLIKFKDVS